VIAVLRLTGDPALEGQWREFEARPLAYCRFPGPTVTLVATGSVEWNGDRPAEVYVPEDRLAEWNAEHA